MKRMSVLMGVAFVDMIGFMLIIPLIPLYALHMNAKAALIGFLTASFSIAQLAASPVWGRVSDPAKAGRRPASTRSAVPMQARLRKRPCTTPPIRCRRWPTWNP